MAPPDGEISTASATNPTGTTLSVSDFPRFDVVAADPCDHAYFKNTKPAAAAINATSDFNKKIMQEWRVLDGNLPETIFVRVYETKISLLRAAIIGATGTPYHDGLFFFDIFLPADYPSKPPQVQYRSFGFRINPNLYENGKVCLSLLNTWSGHKSEKWDRNQSTILQVLLSIQALVLNEKPYFNEPGYTGSRGKKIWEKKAAEYNQDVFVLCCKSALCLLRRPPANFEALVAAHYRERGVAILTACDAYRFGLTSVGGNVAAAGGCGGVSNRFKVMMEKVYGDLVEALAKNGAPVEHFAEQLAGERERKAREVKKKEEKKKKKKTKGDFRKRMMKILEKIWVGTGLKNSSSVANDQVELKVV